MKNKVAEGALSTLRFEVPRFRSAEFRKALSDQLDALTKLFEAGDSEPVDNPPGKLVYRDESGEVKAVQG